VNLVEENILKEYPKAQKGTEVTDLYISYLEDKFKSDLSKMLFATSLCSDDINVSTDFRKVLSRPFMMGGLGGLPYAGFTGMVAFGHHIPDGGDAFIFYGPHIGITDDGELGKMIRPGQSAITNSCGALMLALDRIQLDPDEDVYVPVNVEFDYQQTLLERTVMPYKQQITEAENSAKEITNVTYQNIDKQIHFLVKRAKDEFRCERVFLLGAIIINTSPDFSDYVEVRNFEMIEIKSEKSISSHSILDHKAFKDL